MRDSLALDPAEECVTPEDERLLQEEAAWLHASLFPGRSMNHLVAARYASAWNDCFGAGRGAELTRRLLSAKPDAEAVEYALRLRAGPNLLTRKIQVLLFLVEARGEYLGQFVPLESARHPYWRLAACGVRSLSKLLKGLLAVRRLDLESHARL